MDKENFDIGIVLLNFNTKKDLLKAIECIEKYTKCRYKICIVDNSNNRDERVSDNELLGFNEIDVIIPKENKGYASGNNEGLRWLTDKYTIRNLLVMNPDVSIINDQTIDNLLQKLDNAPNDVCGIQPLVWTPRFGDDPRFQINIRSCMSFWGCCISSFHPLQIIFKSMADDLIYKKQMPYMTDIQYSVPSGCFFITKSEIFEKINFFDERTFLYNEEVILGYKMKKNGFSYLLDTNSVVVHEQGVSTGSKKNLVSRFLTKCQKDSLLVYMKYYLKCNELQIKFVSLLIELNYIGRWIKYKLVR